MFSRGFGIEGMLEGSWFNLPMQAIDVVDMAGEASHKERLFGQRLQTVDV